MARTIAIGFATFALLISAAFMAQAGDQPIFFEAGDVAVTQAV